jgi:hypothetical protein
MNREACQRSKVDTHHVNVPLTDQEKDVGCLSYKLYRLFLSPHSLSVTTVTLGSRLFFILLQINLLRKGLASFFKKVKGKKEKQKQSGECCFHSAFVHAASTLLLSTLLLKHRNEQRTYKGSPNF